ncbi:MAG: DNA cytosine methyltransferase [Candidatus Aminicenantes bacterium]|jgi:DNA (cytosine-5)-methyltransferase 1
MKVLNLYAGIGGNRKLWKNVQVTAVEINPKIANIYQSFFPEDRVIVGDAHKYLLENFKDYDFIWSSPPCPTHSRIRNIAGVGRGQNKPVYPDMRLYQEIILLMQYARFEPKWVIENVKSYYDPLIRPFECERHYFWSNFVINKANIPNDRIHQDIIGSKPVYGFDVNSFDFPDKRLLLRNLVFPKLGKYVLECAFKYKQKMIVRDETK